MPDTTDVYELPFLELGDSPDIASGLEDLAEAVEDELVRIDGRFTTMNGLTPTAGSSTATFQVQSESYVAGGTAFGVTFVAPPSGKVYITLSGYFTQTINGGASLMSWTLRTGGTVGSGTTVGSAANANRALICGYSVNDSAPALFQGSRRSYVSGLTAGNTYNVRVECAVDSASGISGTKTMQVLYRELLIEPILSGSV